MSATGYGSGSSGCRAHEDKKVVVVPQEPTTPAEPVIEEPLPAEGQSSSIVVGSAVAYARRNAAKRPAGLIGAPAGSLYNDDAYARQRRALDREHERLLAKERANYSAEQRTAEHERLVREDASRNAKAIGASPKGKPIGTDESLLALLASEKRELEELRANLDKNLVMQRQKGLSATEHQRLRNKEKELNAAIAQQVRAISNTQSYMEQSLTALGPTRLGAQTIGGRPMPHRQEGETSREYERRLREWNLDNDLNRIRAEEADREIYNSGSEYEYWRQRRRYADDKLMDERRSRDDLFETIPDWQERVGRLDTLIDDVRRKPRYDPVAYLPSRARSGMSGPTEMTHGRLPGESDAAYRARYRGYWRRYPGESDEAFWRRMDDWYALNSARRPELPEMVYDLREDRMNFLSEMSQKAPSMTIGAGANPAAIGYGSQVFLIWVTREKERLARLRGESVAEAREELHEQERQAERSRDKNERDVRQAERSGDPSRIREELREAREEAAIQRNDVREAREDLREAIVEESIPDLRHRFRTLYREVEEAANTEESRERFEELLRNLEASRLRYRMRLEGGRALTESARDYRARLHERFWERRQALHDAARARAELLTTIREAEAARRDEAHDVNRALRRGENVTEEIEEAREINRISDNDVQEAREKLGHAEERVREEYAAMEVAKRAFEAALEGEERFEETEIERAERLAEAAAYRRQRDREFGSSSYEEPILSAVKIGDRHDGGHHYDGDGHYHYHNGWYYDHGRRAWYNPTHHHYRGNTYKPGYYDNIYGTLMNVESSPIGAKSIGPRFGGGFGGGFRGGYGGFRGGYGRGFGGYGLGVGLAGLGLGLGLGGLYGPGYAPGIYGGYPYGPTYGYGPGLYSAPAPVAAASAKPIGNQHFIYHDYRPEGWVWDRDRGHWYNPRDGRYYHDSDTPSWTGHFRDDGHGHRLYSGAKTAGQPQIKSCAYHAKKAALAESNGKAIGAGSHVDAALRRSDLSLFTALFDLTHPEYTLQNTQQQYTVFAVRDSGLKQALVDLKLVGAKDSHADILRSVAASSETKEIVSHLLSNHVSTGTALTTQALDATRGATIQSDAQFSLNLVPAPSASLGRYSVTMSGGSHTSTALETLRSTNGAVFVLDRPITKVPTHTLA